MKPITPITHGYLDYVTVAVFLLAPKLLGFEVYCGPVLRQPTALIQAAKGSSAMFALATESCSALT
jgi:hypothetical protein